MEPNWPAVTRSSFRNGPLILYIPKRSWTKKGFLWGTTNRQQKEGLEFSIDEYKEIDNYCKGKEMPWFFSAWDLPSQRLMRIFNCSYNKVASPMLGNIDLLKEIASERKHTFISTGMSTFEEINKAVQIFRDANCPFELMHCNSTYPMKNEMANLRMMQVCETDIIVTLVIAAMKPAASFLFMACVLGATSLERHITLNRSLYGSDQDYSIQISDLCKLVNDIRTIDSIIGDGKKEISETEKVVRKNFVIMIRLQKIKL